MTDMRPCRGDLFQPMCFPALVDCTFCVHWASGHANGGKCLGRGGQAFFLILAQALIDELGLQPSTKG